MNTQLQAGNPAAKSVVSVYEGSQVDALQRKITFLENEFTGLLSCFGEKEDECRRLKKKVRSLEKLIVELTRKL